MSTLSMLLKSVQTIQYYVISAESLYLRKARHLVPRQHGSTNSHHNFVNDTVTGITISNLISYNLHGFISGYSFLIELCNDPKTLLIAVQEHWLTNDKLQLLNTVHPDFCGFGISAMSKRLGSGIYRGRPFGGIGFLWRKQFNHRFKINRGDGSGRSLTMSFNFNINMCINIGFLFRYYYSSTES